ncbi:type I restriction endonuclease subunit R [Pannus brasiliensis CCIBt3594]|uniref:Type I restriction endonuclease subunit R n=1 Tax=Pannus brasiliensis CCIBt3594 TaxID=1427578 RepID=A0AAW9R0C4_9CHRO
MTFFTEWHENLPEINPTEIEALEIIRRRYLYHLSSGSFTEGTVTLLLGAPLLEKAGFYDPPYRIRGEAFLEIEVEGENEERLRGRIDVLVLQDRFWVLLLESKRSSVALNTALPQTLAYMMGSPHPEKPVFGMVINGDGFQFLKLARSNPSRYDISPVFSPLPLQNQLHEVLKILKRIGMVILETH